MENTREERVKVTLDMPKQLRINIRIAAAQNDRSFQAEVCDMLERKYGTATAEVRHA